MDVFLLLHIPVIVDSVAELGVAVEDISARGVIDTRRLISHYRGIRGPYDEAHDTAFEDLLLRSPGSAPVQPGSSSWSKAVQAKG